MTEWWIAFTRLSNDTRGFLLFMAMVFLLLIVITICTTIYQTARLFT